MQAQKINDYLYLIDLKPAGFENFIASYVVLGEKTAIIETGPTSTVNNLLNGLREIGIKFEDIDFIAVSHIHLDHGGGAGTLMRHLPNAKLIVHPRGAPHLVNPDKLWTQSRQVLGKVAELYGEPEPVSPERIVQAGDGMTVSLGKNIEIEVLETLGHASHHFSYIEKNSKTLFPGDAAGIYLNQFDIIVPTTPPPFHLETTLASIDKLIQKAPRLLCYTHFGVAENAIEKLKRHAAQLRLWADIVAEGIKKGETLEVISENIRQKDPAIKAVNDYVKTHPILGRGVVRQNVQGFMECFLKKSKQSPN
jgi:glyoxylase-like metal-dependent hydrolase (beta-lactamase superfamily II)